jgi:hypothetical protein
MKDIADLEILHEGRRLTNPYLLEVTLAARDRRDIPSSAFDQGRPLVFDLGAEIVKVLQIRCNPASSLAPPVTHEGSALRVGPELIGRHQTTVICVLVDGPQPQPHLHTICPRASHPHPQKPRRVSHRIRDDGGGGGDGGTGGAGSGTIAVTAVAEGQRWRWQWQWGRQRGWWRLCGSSDVGTRPSDLRHCRAR